MRGAKRRDVWELLEGKIRLRARLSSPSGLRCLSRFADGVRAFYFFKLSGSYIVDETINWNRRRNQGMITNALNVVNHCLRLIADGQPLYIFARPGAWAAANVAKTFGT